MKKTILLLTIPIIAIQFIKVDVPQIKEKKGTKIQAPQNVIQILKRSCFDCHSNETKYPWYSHIAPISWYVKSHIKKGREIVNFSIWNSYTKEKKIKILEKIPKAVVIRMPMPTYLWLHKEAKLTKEDKSILKSWAINLKNSLEKEVKN
jgi:hypothetical protein